MIDKSRQVLLKKLLSEAVLLLCRNGLPIDSPFSIEAMIGITLSEDEVFLVSFRETVSPCSTDESCEPLPTEHTGKISKYSHSDCNTRKHASGRWTGSSADVCKITQQVEIADDSDNLDKEMEDGGFGYGSGLGSFRRGGNVAVKSEVDYCVDESLSDFRTRNADSSYENGELEMELKAELDDDYGCEGFEDPVHESESSLPVIDTTSVVSMRRKPVLSNSSGWLPPNRKGRTRRQTLQRSTGSWYSASSADQRQKDPVYLQESAESLSSVEKILRDIYPPTDNQSLRCHVCGSELKCRRTLMEHIRGTHLAIHSYHCPDCGLGFKWRSSLKHHRARNCTLPSVLAAAYDCRPSVGGQREPVSWTDN